MRRYVRDVVHVLPSARQIPFLILKVKWEPLQPAMDTVNRQPILSRVVHVMRFAPGSATSRLKHLVNILNCSVQKRGSKSPIDRAAEQLRQFLQTLWMKDSLMQLSR